jgi:dolichol-phosphate mannosyltransferase
MDLEKLLKRTPIADRGISVVIPAYNEADSLARAVAGIDGLLNQMSRGHEVIVVNDGSTDGTRSVAEKLTADNRHVRLVSHTSHQGYGAALRAGFRLAKYPLVLQLDAPNQVDAGEIDRMLSAIDHVDVVCGYRERIPDSAGRWRYWMYRKALRLVFAVHVRDVDCGFRLYRRSALRRIPIQSNGRFASAEILAKATFMNLLIGEIPVSCQPSGQHISNRPHCRVFREAANVFRHPQFRTSNSTAETIESLTQSA